MNCLIHSATRRDLFSVRGLLRFLPALYPGAEAWLERRLHEVDRGRAACLVALLDGHVAGTLISTPKGRRASKISTFYVSPGFRRSGAGNALLTCEEQRWTREGIDSVYITVPSSRVPLMQSFLTRREFGVSATERDRYGPDRTEVVFSRTLQ